MSNCADDCCSPRPPPGKGEKLENDPIMQERWYHSIEVQPGFFTPGADFQNIHLTRELLRNARVESMNCLDIGAMDCLITLLLIRRGAARVTAYDKRTDTKTRVDCLKKTFDLDFDHISGVSLANLRETAMELRQHPFDIVVFSGVLYHMFDPLAGLAYVRGLVRNGGLVIIETAAVLEDGMGMFFNAGRRYYRGSHTNYWMISIECLDYLLRFVGLSPLDCVYYQEQKDQVTSQQICRVGVVCRAQSDWPIGEGDGMIGRTRHDFSEFIDPDTLGPSNGSPVPYEAGRQGTIMRGNAPEIDVLKTVQATSETRVTDVDRQVRLALNACY